MYYEVPYIAACVDVSRMVLFGTIQLSVKAIGKTNTTKIECTFTNNDDKHDKDDKHFSVQVK